VPRIFHRVASSFWHRRKPLISLAGNLSYRGNLHCDSKAYADFKGQVDRTGPEEGQNEKIGSVT
jgi:hypothetical protein